MAYYDRQNGEEFSKMQEEALNRLREMQKRSKTIVGSPINDPKPSKAPPHEPEVPKAMHTYQSNDILKSIFGDGIKLDTDRLIILLVIYLLYKNHADIKLLLALGYLML